MSESLTGGYAPPTFDEATGGLLNGEPAARPAPALATLLSSGPRLGATRGPAGAGDGYGVLGDADAEETTVADRERRASETALARQRSHAANFQRQMEAEEAYAKSSGRQMSNDADYAARLAGGSDQAADLGEVQRAQQDALIAARMQAEYDAERRAASGPGSRTEKQKIVRVLVPRNAKPGDSLAVATPTTGKFAVEVPDWARPNTHFDCVVTTIVEVRPPAATAAATQNPIGARGGGGGGYVAPGAPGDPPLPEGWEKGTNAKGEVFYVNHNTRTTHWSPPPPAPATPNPMHESADAAPPPPRPPTGPGGMTEEEMIAQAIALSMADQADASDAAPPPAAEAPPPPPAAEPAVADLLDLPIDEPPLPPTAAAVPMAAPPTAAAVPVAAPPTAAAVPVAAPPESPP